MAHHPRAAEGQMSVICCDLAHQSAGPRDCQPQPPLRLLLYPQSRRQATLRPLHPICQLPVVGPPHQQVLPPTQVLVVRHSLPHWVPHLPHLLLLCQRPPLPAHSNQVRQLHRPPLVPPHLLPCPLSLRYQSHGGVATTSPLSTEATSTHLKYIWPGSGVRSPHSHYVGS